MDSPKLILLFSGKRKCGKDYSVFKIKKLLGENNCEIIRISEPIKSYWAEQHGLQLDELLGDGPYKETYRLKMINWSNEQRKKDYGYFCRAACANATRKPIWIVSDIRRKTDLKWFKENFSSLRTVRIITSDQTRIERGWKFEKGVDDIDSECDLDDVNEWDFIIYNNEPEEYESGVSTVYNDLIKYLD